MDTEQPRVSSVLYLSAEPNAVSLTRALVRLILRQWGLVEVTEDAVLVASELATNAIQASGGEGYNIFVNTIKLPSVIMVKVELYDDFMLIEVWDRSLGAPKPASPEDIDEGGRGLIIVETLSAGWGWNTVHPCSGHLGKVVWAELTLPHAPVNPTGLPHRLPRPVLMDMRDLPPRRVMQRVRDKLDQI